MSPSYISSLVVVITAFVQFANIDWSSPEAITPIVTAIVTLVAGAVIAYRRYAKGDVTLIGGIKA